MSKHEIEVQDIKTVWTVWTNTDLTEGRGRQYPIHVCEMESTAMRLSVGNGVMGSTAEVKESFAIKVNNRWFCNAAIEQPTYEDKKKQEQINLSRSAIKKAKDLGLTDKDIQLIARGKQ